MFIVNFTNSIYCMKSITNILFLILVLISGIGNAQIEAEKDSVDIELFKIQGDSVYDTSISLNEVYVFGPLKFASKEENAGNVNVPGGKASKSLKGTKGHGAEKKGQGDTAANKKPVIG